MNDAGLHLGGYVMDGVGEGCEGRREKKAVDDGKGERRDD